MHVDWTRRKALLQIAQVKASHLHLCERTRSALGAETDVQAPQIATTRSGNV